jgi:hypothetical protein
LSIITGPDDKVRLGKGVGGRLDMNAWSNNRAGWAVKLAGETGRKLEMDLGTHTAGALLYYAAYPTLPVPNFFATNEEALEDIRQRTEMIDYVL